MHQNIQRCLQPLALLLALFAAFWPIGVQAQAGQASAQAENGDMYDAVPKPASRHLTLGVLLFPGFEMLDAYGPMEMWGSIRHAPAPALFPTGCILSLGTSGKIDILTAFSISM